METTPRILSSHLASFPQRIIRLLGKITALHGETATLDCGGEVTLKLNRDSHFEVGKYYEVVGKVMEGLQVQVMVGDEWTAKGGIGMFCI
jgi:replication factor A3